MAELPLLSLGSTGTYVELLQLALSRSGNSIAVDGIFGVQTERALRKFQIENKLSSDGIAGPISWATLEPFLYGYFKYTVKANDTLFKIAQRYSTTLNAVKTANPNVDPLNLRIGSTLNIPYGFFLIPFNVSFTPTLLEYCVNGLSVRYPFLRKSIIGYSVMGKPIFALSIGNGIQVFCNASHHANEWITSPAVMRFAEDYCLAYSSGRTIGGISSSNLFSQIELLIVPMVNPDGVSLVTGELRSGPYYNNALRISAAYPNIPFPAGWKANIDGVDTNLQYPAGWERAKEIKFAQGFISPAPRDYVGTSALVAPESRSVYDFTLRNNFEITLSLHTQGEVIYWKYLDYDPPRALETANMLAYASGYRVSVTPFESGFAGYKDWFIERYFKRGYTIEAGIGVSPLPIGQLASIYPAVASIIITAMNEASNS